MSQENVDVFKRAVEAANRSDTEAFLELVHPDVEWHTVLPMVGGDAVYRPPLVPGFGGYGMGTGWVRD